jgi:hypothetical protein
MTYGVPTLVYLHYLHKYLYLNYSPKHSKPNIGSHSLFVAQSHALHPTNRRNPPMGGRYERDKLLISTWYRRACLTSAYVIPLFKSISTCTLRMHTQQYFFPHKAFSNICSGVRGLTRRALLGPVNVLLIAFCDSQVHGLAPMDCCLDGIVAGRFSEVVVVGDAKLAA